MPLYNPFDFTGQVAIVTGAAGGLGRPIALAFADGGADLVLVDLADAALNDLTEEIHRLGRRALAQRVDVSDPEQVQQMVDRAMAEFGRIDVLVNAAGVLYRLRPLEQTLEQWQRQIDVSLKGTWLTCRAIGPIMIEQGRGKIVNFASAAAFHGFSHTAGYGPAKAGVVQLTKTLAVEWSKHGINVNAVAPHAAITPMNAHLVADPANVATAIQRLPVGQLLPADSQVGPVLFLASEAARWITGFTLRVDGGFNAT